MILSLLILCAIPLGYELTAVRQDHDYTLMVEVDSADILRMKRKLDDVKGDEELNFKHQKTGRLRRKPEDSELRDSNVQEELYEVISSEVTNVPQKKKVRKAVQEIPKETLSDITIPDETEYLQTRKTRKETPEENQSPKNEEYKKKSNEINGKGKQELKADEIPEKTAPKKSRSDKQKSKDIKELLDENYVVQYDDTCNEESYHNERQTTPRSIMQKQGSDKNTFLGQENLPYYEEETATVQVTETRKFRHLNPALAGSDIKTEKFQRQNPHNEKKEPPRRSLYDEEEGYAIDEIYEDVGEKRRHEKQSKQRKSRNSNGKKKESEFQNQDYYYREIKK